MASQCELTVNWMSLSDAENVIAGFDATLWANRLPHRGESSSTFVTSARRASLYWVPSNASAPIATAAVTIAAVTRRTNGGQVARSFMSDRAIEVNLLSGQ